MWGLFFFSSRRRHTRSDRDWSSDVCSSDLGFSVLIESFIVTVIGGMGSIFGALIGALLIGMIRSYGSLGFPLFTDGMRYLFMVIVLVARPTGLFGKEVA